MLFALSTLAFLVTFWLIGVAAFATLEGSSAKIMAALRGESTMQVQVSRPVTVRFSPRSVPVQPALAAPRWRVAA